MKHRSPKLLYFTLDPARDEQFWEWVRIGTPASLTYTRGARFSRADAPAFRHAADLYAFLAAFDGNLQSLHVIVDLASVPPAQAADIRSAVTGFPEVQFLFDRRKDAPADLLGMLFPEAELRKDLVTRDDREVIEREWQEALAAVDVSLVQICWEDSDEEDEVLVGRIICGLDNTFDASNLRYALKYRKYISLKVDHKRNFARIQDSRREYLAVCVEEETRQNILMSYILYANGYRVFPVTTRRELERLGEPGFLRGRGVVVRDFDLQFEDEDGASVDEIRGYKYCTEADLEAIRAGKGKAAAHYAAGWNDFTAGFEGRDNRYWREVRRLEADFPVFFVTNGPRHSRIVRPGPGRQARIGQGGRELVLPGLSIPVCGIYTPFHGIREIEQTYSGTRYESGSPDYKIDTARRNHDHSAPLDIYEQVNAMIRRAEAYFDQKRYILATLVAGEAIECMNGFHHRLMVQAYFIQTKAENAIATDVMGSNEHALARDARFRVDKIREDVARFYHGFAESSSKNVLSQIFNDCRLICKEYEHFESEDVFISAMGHLLEGWSLGRTFRQIKHLFHSKTARDD